MTNKCYLWFAVMFLFAVSCQALPAKENEATSAQQVEQASWHADYPFARVALALQGCSSCSYCRSEIRKLTKSSADTSNVSLHNGALEIVYEQPIEIPLHNTIEKLSATGLHNLKLLDVLFDIQGTITQTNNGEYRLALQSTRQTFPLILPEDQPAPPLGESLHLRTIVRGWQGEDQIQLEFKHLL